MPLKIIGAGFGRTGTLSTHTALNQLGFPCYHMMEVFKHRRSHLDFWQNVANTPPGTQHNWEEVFANYTAAVDFPASCAWRELMVAYPDAKVLMTLHPKGADAWYDSTMDTIYGAELMWQYRVLERILPPVRKQFEWMRKLIWQRFMKGTMADRAKAIAHYNAHLAEVKATVPPDRLLVFSADQGWEPLCKFVGVPVPDAPFPSVNDRASMRKQMGRARAFAYLVIAVGATVLAAAVYGLANLVF